MQRASGAIIRNLLFNLRFLMVCILQKCTVQWRGRKIAVERAASRAREIRVARREYAPELAGLWRVVAAMNCLNVMSASRFSSSASDTFAVHKAGYNKQCRSQELKGLGHGEVYDQLINLVNNINFLIHRVSLCLSGCSERQLLVLEHRLQPV